MPSPGVLLLCAALASLMYVGDKVVHLKPVHKVNHVACRVITFGQKCRPKAR